MRAVHELVSGRLPFPMLLQGTAPKSILLERFRSTPNAVLFATASFWQGVDVPGTQLSCVIIDKLPFAVPERSDRSGAGARFAGRWAESVRGISGAGSRAGAEAGIWQIDPLEDRPRDSGDPR